MRLMQFQIDDIIKTALLEDINYIDVTTDYLVDENSVSTAKYVSKDEGVLCGIDVAMRVFQLLDSNIKCEIFIHDGEKVKKGDIIAKITGSTRALLKGERTALNIVQHMSGVATATNRCVELVKGTKASVADTRKTLPGLRVLQKYAVTVGGGKNHRYNLSDCAMLKDTHLDAYGSMTAFAISSFVILSSMIISTPSVRASLSSSRFPTSTSILTVCPIFSLRAFTAPVMLPYASR